MRRTAIVAKATTIARTTSATGSGRQRIRREMEGRREAVSAGGTVGERAATTLAASVGVAESGVAESVAEDDASVCVGTTVLSGKPVSVGTAV
jgi:hypothetical protein